MARKETIIYFALGTLNVISGFAEIDWLNYLTKPLLMISLGIFYFLKTKNKFNFQDKMMLLALLFSCFGDTFLMFQSQNPNFFLFGLGSFLIAQVFYTIIFKKQGKREFLKSLPFIFYSIILVYFLWSNIPSSFKIPILGYTFAITMMGIMAIQRKVSLKSYLLVLIGAITFIASDSLIAINKFAFEIPFSGFWIMSTYIVAQYLIVEGIIWAKIEKK